jgi:POT family proton-dependent oligopeptide transporter
MVGQLYPKGSNKLDSAFTIFYMGINLGALIGNSICSIVGDVKHDGVRDLAAFKWGFLAASIAMVLGTLIFLFLKNKYVNRPDGSPIGGKPVKGVSADGGQEAKFSTKATGISVVVALGLMAIFHYVVGVNWIYSLIYSSGLSLAGLILSDKSLNKEERDRIWVIYIVGFFVIFFWACFEQAGSSLTYIADHQTDTHLFGWEMPPTLVQNANSLFIIIFAPLFSLIWIALAKKNREPISPVKQSMGLLLLAIGYLIIAFQVKSLTGDAKLGVIWLIVMYLFHTLGELCLSPIGLSLVSKLAPLRFSSLLMGVFFLSNASGYALAGTLGALIPATQDKYEAATAKGIDLHGILEKTVTPTADQLATLKDLKIDTTYPTFAGFTIHNLFEFFMVFVILPGVASLLLFLISGKLRKMMHGIR